MPPAPEVTSIEVSGNTLRARGDLGDTEEKAFARAARELLATEQTDLVIDISGVTYISSVYVRDIALAMVQARQHGRSVCVRATARTARMLSLGGVDKLGSVEVVE